MRSNKFLDTKNLKSPEKGGSKKEFENFIEKIDNHVSINWEFGQDVAYVLKNNKLPIFKERKDLNDEDEKVKWKVHL